MKTEVLNEMFEMVRLFKGKYQEATGKQVKVEFDEFCGDMAREQMKTVEVILNDHVLEIIKNPESLNTQIQKKS